MIKRFIPQPGLLSGTRYFGSPETLDDVFDIAMIRERPVWIPLPNDGRLLQLGGGKKVLNRWMDLDYPQWDAEKDPLPYEDESIDAVFSAHAIDHMSATAVQDLLVEIQRVLRPGCVFTNVVPHHMATLAWECLEHKTRYGIKTWRNILDNPAYCPINVNGPRPTIWKLKVGFNMIMGVEERNLVLVTQLVKDDH